MKKRKIDISRIAKIAIQGTAGGIENFGRQLAKAFEAATGMQMRRRNSSRYGTVRPGDVTFEAGFDKPIVETDVTVDADPILNPETGKKTPGGTKLIPGGSHYHPTIGMAQINIRSWVSGDWEMIANESVPVKLMRDMGVEISDDPGHFESHRAHPTHPLDWTKYDDILFSAGVASTTSPRIRTFMRDMNYLSFKLNVFFRSEADRDEMTKVWSAIIRRILAELKQEAKDDNHIVWVKGSSSADVSKLDHSVEGNPHGQLNGGIFTLNQPRLDDAEVV